MENPELDQFEIQWEKSLKEPPLRQVDVKKIEVDLSLDKFLDKFMLLAENSVQQGKIKRADYDELMQQTSNMKKVLEKIKGGELIAKEIEERSKKISRDIQDRVDKLKDDFKRIL